LERETLPCRASHRQTASTLPYATIREHARAYVCVCVCVRERERERERWFEKCNNWLAIFETDILFISHHTEPLYTERV